MTRLISLAPGVAAAAAIALLASALARQLHAPVMLLALLLGLALGTLLDGPRFAPGVGFTARTLLRVGVALLGLRITWAQLTALGWDTLAALALAVALTIAVGVLVARALGQSALLGLLTGGATAICGASAALAIAAALPAHPRKEQATLFTIIGISAIGTLAMLAYPPLVRAAGWDMHHIGVFLGSTIHDVAQVVGAGYSVSQEAGDTATLVKMVRVAMLVPVVLLTTAITRRSAAAPIGTADGAPAAAKPPPLVPAFVAAFALLVAANSLGWIPDAPRLWGQQASGALLVTAMVAIGLKTQLRAVVSLGLRPVLLMAAESAFLVLLTLAWLRWG